MNKQLQLILKMQKKLLSLRTAEEIHINADSFALMLSTLIEMTELITALPDKWDRGAQLDGDKIVIKITKIYSNALRETLQ